MPMFLFITEQAEKVRSITRQSGELEWSCHSKCRAGDSAYVYLTGGQGIVSEWQITSDAHADPIWDYICDVRHVRSIKPAITISELREKFGREEWRAPHVNFRNNRSLLLEERVAEKLRALRPAAPNPSAKRPQNGKVQLAVIEGEAYKTEATLRRRNRAVIEMARSLSDGCCVVCGFSFQTTFGPKAKAGLHAHHSRPISDGIAKTTVADIDLVCPNCHAMAHTRRRPYTRRELKAMLKRNRSAKK